MPENNMERPSDSATNNAKARWSVLNVLRENPDGLSKAELDERVHHDWPGVFDSLHLQGGPAIGAALENLKRDGRVRRDAERQKWTAVEIPESARPPQTEEEGAQRGQPEPESEWYGPVADELVNMGLCTSARPSGDDLNGPRWTNPDVVGLIRPGLHALPHNFPTQLVAVEIKRAVDAPSLLTGFAEACAYLDFAHISWLVVPWLGDGEAIARVERLCVVHGLGLAYVREEEQEDGNGEKVLWLEVGVHPRCRKPGAREFDEFLKRLADRGINL